MRPNQILSNFGTPTHDTFYAELMKILIEEVLLEKVVNNSRMEAIHRISRIPSDPNYYGNCSLLFSRVKFRVFAVEHRSIHIRYGWLFINCLPHRRWAYVCLCQEREFHSMRRLEILSCSVLGGLWKQPERVEAVDTMYLPVEHLYSYIFYALQDLYV